MNLTIRHRLYALSLVPLFIISISTLFFTYTETGKLTAEQMEATRSSMMEVKEEELKSYLQIADTAITPLKEENSFVTQVVGELANIKFAQSGYLFGYDSKGVRLLLGQSSQGIGENFWSLKDKKDSLFIQAIINNAKNGDGYATYYFPKPGASVAEAKLSYSIYLPQWDLIIGTGFYTDDVDAIIADMQVKADEKLADSLTTIATASLFILLVAGIYVYFVNRSIMRPLGLFDESIKTFASGDADLAAHAHLQDSGI